MLQGFMVVIDIPVILILMKPAMKALDDYCKQKKNCNGSVHFGYDKLKSNALGICEELAKRAE